MPEDCIFCAISRGDSPARFVRRDDGFFAIHDIAPKADVHVLCIPEKHVETFHDVSVFSPEESKRMLDFIADTGKELGLDDYRIFVSVGAGAGQTVFHLHWHLMAGNFLPGPRV